MVRAFLVYLVIVALAFAITSWLLDGMDVSGGFFAYLWVALIFGVINAILGTILRILTLPLTVLTLGLFSIIVNALLLNITDGLTDHLTIDHFWWTAIWGALILSIVTVLIQIVLGMFIKTDTRRA